MCRGSLLHGPRERNTTILITNQHPIMQMFLPCSLASQESHLRTDEEELTPQRNKWISHEKTCCFQNNGVLFSTKVDRHVRYLRRNCRWSKALHKAALFIAWLKDGGTHGDCDLHHGSSLCYSEPGVWCSCGQVQTQGKLNTVFRLFPLTISTVLSAELLLVFYALAPASTQIDISFSRHYCPFSIVNHCSWTICIQ